MPKRKTHEEYEYVLQLKHGEKYKLLTRYVNGASPIQFACTECNNIHQMVAKRLLGNGCSLCGTGRRSKKNTITNARFLSSLRKVHGTNIIPTERYKKRDVQINFYAYDCGHTWKTTPDSVLQGNRCKKCAMGRSINTRTKNHDEFVREVYSLVGKEYMVDSEYQKSNKEIFIIHSTCKDGISHRFSTTPNSFLQGKRCPKCYGTPKKTTEQFKEEVYYLVKDEYTVKGKYYGNKIKMKFIHNKCKDGGTFDFYLRPDSFLCRGDRCPKCSPSCKDTKETFEKKLREKRGSSYTLIGDYENSSTPVYIEHSCGYRWPITPNNILGGQNCPICYKMQKESKGEKRIFDYLTKHNIKFFKEYTFDNLKNQKKLRYDFGIPLSKEKVILIEYHGILHYESIEYFGGDERFRERKVNDQLKCDYCRKNNIPLLIIPYWEFNNIEGILNNFLKKHYPNVT